MSARSPLGLKTETNGSAWNRLARKRLGCSFCSPHKMENSNWYKRSPRKPKYKDHR